MLPEAHPIFQSRSLGGNRPKRLCLYTKDLLRTILLEGSSLKWCFMGAPNYEYMELSAIPNYTNAVLNDSGTLLCLSNANEVQVLALSWDETKPDSYRISVPGGVKQVLWHPRGCLDSCLAVLNMRDEILLYELLSEDSSTPTTVFNASTNELGMGSSVKDIESMCFSADGLTLYLLSISEGADVFSIYPCMPSELSITRKALKYNFNKALLQYQELSENDSPDLKRKATRQLHFMSKLYNQPYSADSSESNEFQTFHIQKAYRSARAQGPFTISPFPEKLYLATAKQIRTIALEDETTELLLITFDDGTILECFPDLTPIMSWEDTGSSERNSLVSVGSLKLPGTISLVYGSCFVLLSVEKAVVVDLGRLTRSIERSLDDCDVTELSEDDLTEEVTEKKGAFQCVGLWLESGTPRVLLLSDKELASIEIKSMQTPAVSTAEKTEKNETKCQRPYSQPLSEMQALKEKAQLLAKSPLSTTIPSALRQKTFNNKDNEDQLSLLTDISKEVLSRVTLAQTLGLSLHLRLLGQQDELTQHLRDVSELRTKKERVSAHLASQKLRWEAIQDKNKSIASRFENLHKTMTQISKSSQLQSQPIAKAEMEWFKELRNQVLRFNRLVHEQQDLSESLSSLKLNLEYVRIDPTEVVGHGKNSAESVGGVPWDDLQAMLAKDSRIIKECQTELQLTTQELDS
ncbi:LAQU0S02e05754g1_1 [Lachancea quebecensis]|uniref:LAQU0S02e05754g1_1 n=1 Tax=Lachancea quebecensis TaxID=1654605 RepID=A0A0P1KMV2_9SACH|nr:LAQU0S02e05754g1_1 [Lachancea quebecensis]